VKRVRQKLENHESRNDEREKQGLLPDWPSSGNYKNAKLLQGRKLRLLRRLPAWFSLDKYPSERRLHAFDWFYQIVIRQKCFAQLRAWRAAPTGTALDRLIGQALSSLRENPVCDIGSHPFNSEAFKYQDLESFKRPVVHSMTLRDLYLIDHCKRQGLSEIQIDEGRMLVASPPEEAPFFFAFTPSG
jgi:hypothetical protein